MQDALTLDMQRTLHSRALLREHPNLLLWYRRLFDRLLADSLARPAARILEIGSGASPLKSFVPSVITSDVMPLPDLDHVFDCHRIDEYAAIEDGSLDAIVLTNVLHHLREPVGFLRRARRKLAADGRVLLAEPYFSWLSLPIYKALHPEPVDFSVREPVLDVSRGPLGSSNQAIPYLLFFGRRGWLEPLAGCYDLDRMRIGHFTSLAYMATGGISRRLPVPRALYRALLPVDEWLARTMPRAFASFFTASIPAGGSRCD